MAQGFITRRGGGGAPKPPSSYTFLQLISGTTNWTVPADGWYKIYCVGKSGDGGSGGGLKNNGDDDYAGNGGSGGNSGGVSISVLKLKAGVVIPVTVNTSVSSFGSYLSATAGARGNDGADGPAVGNTPAPVGVGQGAGGNILNSTGLQGGFGGQRGPAYNTLATPGQSLNGNSGGIVSTSYGPGQAGGGGCGNDLQSLSPYYTKVDKHGGGFSKTAWPWVYGAWSAPQAVTSPPVFYGSGGGGYGVPTDGVTENGDYSTTPKRPGGLGSPGGVIIEKGVA